MSPFIFFHGDYQTPTQPLEPIPPYPGLGLVNDYYENGINTLGYQPFQLQIGHRVFQSDICHRSYEEWRFLIDVNPGNMRYHLYAVLRPEDDYREQEVIDLHGALDVFPLFVLENPTQDFLFEFIMVPNDIF